MRVPGENGTLLGSSFALLFFFEMGSRRPHDQNEQRTHVACQAGIGQNRGGRASTTCLFSALVPIQHLVER